MLHDVMHDFIWSKWDWMTKLKNDEVIEWEIIITEKMAWIIDAGNGEEAHSYSWIGSWFREPICIEPPDVMLQTHFTWALRISDCMLDCAPNESIMRNIKVVKYFSYHSVISLHKLKIPTWLSTKFVLKFIHRNSF